MRTPAVFHVNFFEMIHSQIFCLLYVFHYLT